MEYAFGGSGDSLPTPAEVAAALVERFRAAAAFITSKLTGRDVFAPIEGAAVLLELSIAEEVVGGGAMATYIGNPPKVSKADREAALQGDQAEQQGKEPRRHLHATSATAPADNREGNTATRRNDGDPKKQ